MQSRKKSILKGYKIPKQRSGRVALPSGNTSSEDVSTSYGSPADHSIDMLMSCIHESPPTQFHSLTSNQIKVTHQIALEASTPKVRFAEEARMPVIGETKVPIPGATKTLSTAGENEYIEMKSNRKHVISSFDQLQRKPTHSNANLPGNKLNSAVHREFKRFEPNVQSVQIDNEPTINSTGVVTARGDNIAHRLKSLQIFKSAYFSYHPDDNAYSKLKQMSHNGDCGDYGHNQHFIIPQVWSSNITSSENSDPYTNSTTLKKHILKMHSTRDNATDKFSVSNSKSFSDANSPSSRQPTYEFYEEVSNPKSSESSLESDKSAVCFIPSDITPDPQRKQINSESFQVPNIKINKYSSSLSSSPRHLNQSTSFISTKITNKSHSSNSTNRILNTPSSSVPPKDNSFSWTFPALPPPNVNMSSMADSFVDAAPDQKNSQETKAKDRLNFPKNISGSSTRVSSFSSNSNVVKTSRNNESETPSFLDCDQHTASSHSLPKLNDRLSVYKAASFCSNSDYKPCKSLHNVQMPIKEANTVGCSNFLNIFYSVIIIVGTLICTIGLCIVVTGGFHTSFQLGFNGLPNVFSLQLDVNVDHKIKDSRSPQGHSTNGAHSEQRDEGNMLNNTAGVQSVNEKIKIHTNKRDGIIVKEHVEPSKQTSGHKRQSIMLVKNVPETTQNKLKLAQVDAHNKTMKESMTLQPSKHLLRNTTKKPSSGQKPIHENNKGEQSGSVLPKGENKKWSERFTTLQYNAAAQVADILTQRTSEIMTDSFGQLSRTLFNQLSKRLTKTIKKGKCRPLIDFFNKECVLDMD